MIVLILHPSTKPILQEVYCSTLPVFALALALSLMATGSQVARSSLLLLIVSFHNVTPSD